MPSKFLNANTDNTLGGNNSSNVNVPSQKAVKDYVDGKLYNEKFGNGLALQTNTSAAAAVTASMTNYELKTNGRVSVKFKYANSASSTLDVNGTGAKGIYYFATAGNTTATAMPANYIKAGDVATFVYDGSHYVLTGIKRFALSLNVSGSTATGTTGTASPSISGTIAIGTGSGTVNYTPAGTITPGTISVSGGTTASNLLTKNSTFTVTPTAATTTKLSAALASNVVTASGGTSSNMITSSVAPTATQFLTDVTVSGVATGGTATNVHAAASTPTITLASGTTGDVTVATSGTSGTAAAQGHTHSVPASTATAIAAYNSVSSTTYKKPTTASQTAPSWSVTGTLVSGTTDDYNLSFSWSAGTIQATVATGGWSDGTSSNGVISAISFGTGNAAPSNHTHTASATGSTAQTVITAVPTTMLSATATAPTITLSKPSGDTATGDISVIGSVSTGSATVTPTQKYGVGFASQPSLSRKNAVARLTSGSVGVTLSTGTTGDVDIPTNAISGASVTPASDTSTETAVKTIGTISQGTTTFAGTGVELTATPNLSVASHSHDIPSLTVTGTAE